MLLLFFVLGATDAQKCAGKSWPACERLAHSAEKAREGGATQAKEIRDWACANGDLESCKANHLPQVACGGGLWSACADAASWLSQRDEIARLVVPGCEHNDAASCALLEKIGWRSARVKEVTPWGIGTPVSGSPFLAPGVLLTVLASRDLLFVEAPGTNVRSTFLAKNNQSSGEIALLHLSADATLRGLVKDHGSTLRLWLPKDGGQHGARFAAEVREPAVFGSDGTVVLATRDNDSVQKFDARNGASLAAPLKLGAPVTAIASDPKSGRFAVGLKDGKVLLLDNGQVTAQAAITDQPIFNLAFNADGTALFAASAKQCALFSSSGLVTRWQRDRAIGGAAFSLDGKLLALSMADGAEIWNAETGEAATPPIKLAGSSYTLPKAVFSPGGDALYVSGNAGLTRVALKDVALNDVAPKEAVFPPFAAQKWLDALAQVDRSLLDPPPPKIDRGFNAVGHFWRDNQPAAGVIVRLRPRAFLNQFASWWPDVLKQQVSPVTAKTDKNGAVFFHDLAKINWQIETDQPGMLPSNNQLQPDNTPETQFSIKIEPAAVIDIEVRTPEGKPAIGARVHLNCDEPIVEKVDAQGHLKKAIYPNRSCKLFAQSDAGLSLETSLPLPKAGPYPVSLALLPAGDEHLPHLKVTNEIGKPLSGIELGAPDLLQRQSDANGLWWSPRPLTAWHITSGGQDLFLEQLRDQLHDGVVALNTSTLLIRREPSWKGRIFLALMKRQDNAWTLPKASEWSREMFGDEAKIPVGAGSWGIWAQGEERVSDLMTVEVAPGETSTLTVAPGKPPVIKGKFVDAKSGEPLLLATLEGVCLKASNPNVDEEDSGGPAAVATDPSGRFEWRCPLPGRRVMKVGKNGYASHELLIELGEHDVDIGTIALARGGTARDEMLHGIRRPFDIQGDKTMQLIAEINPDDAAAKTFQRGDRLISVDARSLDDFTPYETGAWLLDGRSHRVVLERKGKRVSASWQDARVAVPRH